MTIVLMVLSLLATTVGIVAIAWGIFDQAFDDNGLIVSGSISAATGLVLFGLGSLVRQLRRISQSLEEGALEVRHPPESATHATAHTTTVGPPPLPTREPNRNEDTTMRPQPAPFPEQPRMPAPLAMGPPIIEVPDDAPLSSKPPGPVATPPASLANAPSRSEHTHSVKQSVFDSSFDSTKDGAAKRELPRWQRRATGFGPVDDRAEERHRRSLPVAERPPAILKSGVIEGKPYTLYADGSIVVELTQGKMRFASAEALRSHIEKKT